MGHFTQIHPLTFFFFSLGKCLTKSLQLNFLFCHAIERDWEKRLRTDWRDHFYFNFYFSLNYFPFFCISASSLSFLFVPISVPSVSKRIFKKNKTFFHQPWKKNYFSFQCMRLK